MHMIGRPGPACLLLGLLLWGCSDGEEGQTTDARPGDLAAADLGLDRIPQTDLAPPRPDGKTNLGAACSADHHCSTGLTCDTSQPNGMCTRSCKADAECGGGVRWGCFSGACRTRCNVRSPLNDCRASYVCRLQAGKASCAADCTAKPCAGTLTCDKNSGLCLNPKGGSVGAACGTGIGDCSGTPNGVCITLGSMSKAICTLPCSPFTAPCPSSVTGAYCSAGDVKGEYCLFTCDTKAPKCPHKTMICKSVGNYALCLQP